MKLKIIAIFLVYLLAGCAAPLETRALMPVSKVQTIALEAPITRLLGSNTIEQGLLPGEYKGTVENEQGTFFQGPARSFFERQYPNGRLQVRPGGFWLPKMPSVKPRLFFVFEPEQYSADSVDEAVRAMTLQHGGAIANAGGGVGVQAVGGAIGAALVSAMIESGRGEHMLLGEIPNDPLVLKLVALATKLKEAQ